MGPWKTTKKQALRYVQAAAITRSVLPQAAQIEVAIAQVYATLALTRATRQAANSDE